MAKSTQKPIYRSFFPFLLFGRREEKCQGNYRNFYHHLYLTDANGFFKHTHQEMQTLKFCL